MRFFLCKFLLHTMSENFDTGWEETPWYAYYKKKKGTHSKGFRIQKKWGIICIDSWVYSN